MKTRLCVFGVCSVLLLAGCSSRRGATGDPVGVQSQGFAAAEPLSETNSPVHIIADRGLHHRTWQKVVRLTNAEGQILMRTNAAFQELATGLHYWSENQWLESKTEIEPHPTGAIARQGQHKITFGNSITQPGVIDLETPEGKRLRSHVIGLGYRDTVTGSNVFIAEVQESIGQILMPNQVIYENAFSNLQADVRYTYQLASFEQDIVLRERPPPPETFGLDPATTTLQVWTEFLSPPQPEKRFHSLFGLPDETLDFGIMKIGQGQAFSLGEEAELNGVLVAKQWVNLEGRTFLVEEVQLAAIQEQLQALPAGPGASLKRSPASYVAAPPARRPAQAQPLGTPMTVGFAAATPGFVLDYLTLLTDTNDFTFFADTTYFITNKVNFSGRSVIEGGTVIKLQPTFNGNNSAWLVFWGSLECKTASYRPAIITAKSDNSVGEIISGSTGTPSFYWQAVAMASSNPVLKHLSIRYATIGLNCGIYTTNVDISDVQLSHCGHALWNETNTVSLRNLLLYRVTNAFDGFRYTVKAEHLTINECHRLSNDIFAGTNTLNLTNCLLVNITNWGTATIASNNVAVASGSGIFQTVGGGRHYLAAESPYRNAGTTNLSSGLLSALRRTTTYPPISYVQMIISNDLTLFPQAQRDVDIPDLGYHYDPIDYAVAYTRVTNATVQLTAGTAVAIFGTNVFTYGIGLLAGGGFSSVGTPASMNRMFEYSAVQETAGAGWEIPFSGLLADGFSGQPVGINCRFTDWSVMAQNAPHVSAGNVSPVLLRDCQFHGGLLNLYAPATLTNCLLERVITDWSDDGAPVLQNNLWFGGVFYLFSTGTNAVIKDNLFDRTGLGQGFGGYDGGHNAYVTNYDRFTPATGDIVLTNSPAYQTGSLGAYYYSTAEPLVNAGSTNANVLGLYHYTTTTNNFLDGFGVVDIGFHYVALGDAYDTDNDGMPEYEEDVNGNGSLDSGETRWGAGGAGEPGLKVRILKPNDQTTLP